MTHDLHPDWLAEEGIQHLLRIYRHAGSELRFVGGVVRDTLLGRKVGDIDAATPLPPEQGITILEQSDMKVIPTGLKHGTITALLPGGRPVEITTLRMDAACDGRHAEVTFTDDWQADAARRDFTLNALYLDAEGRLYDYVGGAEDALRGHIRFIGNAEARIHEDYLRILRFFRFFSTHGMPPADVDALAACHALSGGIEKLSGERIRAEMFKLLAAPDPVPALRLMHEDSVLAMVIHGGVMPEALLHTPADALLRLAVLMRGNAEDTKTLATRWRLSNAERDRLHAALTCPLPTLATLSDKEAKILIRKHGAQAFMDWLWREYAQTPFAPELFTALRNLATTWQPPVFPVSGKDLLAIGMPPGDNIGIILREMEKEWEFSDYLSSKEALLAGAKKLL